MTILDEYRLFSPEQRRRMFESEPMTHEQMDKANEEVYQKTYGQLREAQAEIERLHSLISAVCEHVQHHGNKAGGYLTWTAGFWPAVEALLKVAE
jgi:hypothetical protein